jgi:hypothetical protein
LGFNILKSQADFSVHFNAQDGFKVTLKTWPLHQDLGLVEPCTPKPHCQFEPSADTHCLQLGSVGSLVFELPTFAFDGQFAGEGQLCEQEPLGVPLTQLKSFVSNTPLSFLADLIPDTLALKPNVDLGSALFNADFASPNVDGLSHEFKQYYLAENPKQFTYRVVSRSPDELIVDIEAPAGQPVRVITPTRGVALGLTLSRIGFGQSQSLMVFRGDGKINVMFPDIISILSHLPVDSTQIHCELQGNGLVVGMPGPIPLLYDTLQFSAQEFSGAKVALKTTFTSADENMLTGLFKVVSELIPFVTDQATTLPPDTLNAFNLTVSDTTDNHGPYVALPPALGGVRLDISETPYTVYGEDMVKLVNAFKNPSELPQALLKLVPPQLRFQRRQFQLGFIQLAAYLMLTTPNEFATLPDNLPSDPVVRESLQDYFAQLPPDINQLLTSLTQSIGGTANNDAPMGLLHGEFAFSNAITFATTGVVAAASTYGVNLGLALRGDLQVGPLQVLNLDLSLVSQINPLLTGTVQPLPTAGNCTINILGQQVLNGNTTLTENGFELAGTMDFLKLPLAPQATLEVNGYLQRSVSDAKPYQLYLHTESHVQAGFADAQLAVTLTEQFVRIGGHFGFNLLGDLLQLQTQVSGDVQWNGDYRLGGQVQGQLGPLNFNTGELVLIKSGTTTEIMLSGLEFEYGIGQWLRFSGELAGGISTDGAVNIDGDFSLYLLGRPFAEGFIKRGDDNTITVQVKGEPQTVPLQEYLDDVTKRDLKQVVNYRNRFLNPRNDPNDVYASDIEIIINKEGEQELWVGAPGPKGGDQYGRVYIYDLQTGRQKRILVSPQAEPGDLFGTELEKSILDERNVIISAPGATAINTAAATQSVKNGGALFMSDDDKVWQSPFQENINRAINAQRIESDSHIAKKIVLPSEILSNNEINAWVGWLAIDSGCEAQVLNRVVFHRCNHYSWNNQIECFPTHIDENVEEQICEAYFFINKLIPALFSSKTKIKTTKSSSLEKSLFDSFVFHLWIKFNGYFVPSHFIRYHEVLTDCFYDSPITPDYYCVDRVVQDFYMPDSFHYQVEDPETLLNDPEPELGPSFGETQALFVDKLIYRFPEQYPLISRLAIGAPGKHQLKSPDYQTGVTYLYEIRGQANLTNIVSAPDGLAQYFGASLAVKNKQFYIGAPGYANVQPPVIHASKRLYRGCDLLVLNASFNGTVSDYEWHVTGPNDATIQFASLNAHQATLVASGSVNIKFIIK